MVMLLADRFTKTFAPAIAANVDGGIGTHTSSQISTCTRISGRSLGEKMRSVPNGTSSPSKRNVVDTASRAAANCRFS